MTTHTIYDPCPICGGVVTSIEHRIRPGDTVPLGDGVVAIEPDTVTGHHLGPCGHVVGTATWQSVEAVHVSYEVLP